MSTLTAKQEAFALRVAEGATQADAYREVYQTKAKPEVIHVKASQLMANGKVGLRVAELRKELEEASLWTRLDSVQVLSEIAKGKDPEAKPTDRVNATKALNQMHGWDKMTVDHTSSDGTMSPTVIQLAAPDDNGND